MKNNLREWIKILAQFDALEAKADLVDEMGEALKLADATLSGANMDMGVVEKKVKQALAKYEALKEENK